jgi:hypothetical protein
MGGHSAVYDAGNNRMIIVGGSCSISSVNRQVWVVTNANGVSGTPTFSVVPTTGEGPDQIGFGSAAYDPGSNRLIVLRNRDVWVLTNANGLGGVAQWSKLNPGGVAPPQTTFMALGYDPARNKLIAATLGGVEGPGGPNDVISISGVWALSNANGLNGGAAWSELDVGGATPGDFFASDSSYDPVSQRIFAYFGLRNYAWIFDEKPPPCSYSLSVRRRTVSAAGGTVSVDLTTRPECSWDVVYSSTSHRLTTPESEKGSATIVFNAAPNQYGPVRTTARIAGQPFEIFQTAPTCSYLFSPDLYSIGASGLGDSGRIDVITSDNCSWSAISGANWLTLTPGTARGSGTVFYKFAPNTEGTVRRLPISIAGRTISTSQSAGDCSFDFRAPTQLLPWQPASLFQTVSAPSSCVWAVSSSSPWLTVTGVSTLAGSGVLGVNVGSNESDLARTGIVRIGGSALPILQKSRYAMQGFRFIDVPASHPLADYIGLMHYDGIASGCGAVRF